MAVVRLSDVFVPAVYASYTSIDSPERTAFEESGVAVANPAMDAIARAGNKTGTIPFWKDLDASVEPNYSNDDPADLAVPNKIGTGTMTYRKVFLNQSYSSMDLVAEMLAADPLAQIKNRFGTYWKRQKQRRLIAMCVGILADNVANDAGDMLVDISGLVGDAAVFNSDVFIDAVFTAGDNSDVFTAIAVHSVIMARMVKNDDIVDVRDSDGRLLLQTYKGKAVIVDDSLPVSGTGQNRIFTSILFGRAGFGYAGLDGHAVALGEGVSENPAWVDRTEQAGHGGGMEVIGERKTWLMHPFGFEWIEGTLAEFSPTLADLRLAVHWNRVIDRKQVPLAFIKSKG